MRGITIGLIMGFKNSIIFLFLLLSSSLRGFGEGTKEIWPDPAEETRILIARGSIGGQQRDPFAIYNGAEDYRLYIHIQDPLVESIYFGIGERIGASPVAANGWRIHAPDGTVVYQSSVPTTGQGFIETYDQALRGPSFLDPMGYDAQVVNLGAGFLPGDYFMTFEVNNNTSRAFRYFDITVINTQTIAAITGRVFSKNWQFQNSSFGFPAQFNVFKGMMFIYSSDGIVTKLNPNGMEGRDFSFSCNESGCYQIGPLYNAQQARQSQPGPSPHTYPQFKIFLNDPDNVVYPDGIIGRLVDGSVTTTSYCNNGTIDFSFLSEPPNAVGTVEIILSLSTLVPPMVDRILITNNVPGGNYTITWDGLDGIGNQVPSGSTFPFTLRYTNGLTNMPLWDVEENVNGFIVTLVRPVLVPPLDDPAFYWDDALVGGTSVINPPGCTVPPAASCHAWDNDWGNQKSINTWWYLVSNSTANVNITYKKSPGVLQVVQPLPPINSICPGNTMTFSVVADELSAEYHWSWPGGTQITALPTLNVTFPAGTAAGSFVMQVNGTNYDCGDGPITDIPYIVNPVPDLTTSLSQSTCSDVPFSIALNADPPATNYTWNVGLPDCSANILSCPTGNGAGLAITGNLAVTNLSQGTVNYHITPVAACTGTTKTLTITVDPKPNVTSPVGDGEERCSGATIDLILESGLTGPSLTWTWEPVCTNLLPCPAPGTSANIQNTLQLNSNALPGSAIYTITPTFGGCAGDPYIYTVTVLQLPDVSLAPFSPVCLNTPAFALTGGTPSGPGGVYTLGGVPLTIFDPSATGTGTFDITYTYTDAEGCVSSDQKSILVQSLITPSLTGDPTACLGVGKAFSTDQMMADYQWAASPDGIVTGSGYEVTITWPSTGIKTITLTYTDPNGCTTIPANTNVTVNPLPVPSIATGNFNVCVDKSYDYTTQSGMSGYTWSVSPGNAITFSDHSANATWNVTGNGWIEVNYVDLNGCTAVSPTRVPVLVNPSPVYTVTGSASVCAGSTTTFQLQGVETGDWTISVSGSMVPPVTNVNSVSVIWAPSTSPSQSVVTVDYVNSLGCPGTTTSIIDIQPLPIIDFNISTPSPVCQDFPTPSVVSVVPGGPAATYLWQVSPAGNALIANPTGNPTQITWKLPGSTPQTALLTLSATTAATTPACTATSPPMAITINPKPNTQLATCFDQVTTTNGRPILLKGGTPLGATGQYFINQTNGTPVTWFNPVSAGAGTHTIYYGYTDNNGCIAFDSRLITVVSQFGFTCGNQLTDPRDNKTYKTVQLGSQCWMKENLRYSAPAPYVSTNYSMPQTDNCLFERYCLSTDPGCTAFGGFYQWDELMQYTSDLATTRQGFCPPGWHVPAEAEWEMLINFATQNIGSGVAGSFLTDMNPTAPFNADPAGIFYLNSIESFSSLPLKGLFFWTSSYDASTGKAVARGMNSENVSVSRYEAAKADAFPVRCVRD